MKSNRYQWQSFLPRSVLQKSCCKNIAKIRKKHLHQDFYFDNIGGSREEIIQGGVEPASL